MANLAGDTDADHDALLSRRCLARFEEEALYIAGTVIGAIAVIIIGLVRGLPDRPEREAAEGGALPALAANGRRPSAEAKDPAGGVACYPGSFLPDSQQARAREGRWRVAGEPGGRGRQQLPGWLAAAVSPKSGDAAWHGHG